ncbi:MAG: hypothetical protein Q4F80_00670 [bacterium]|nr:hypothetical protein [bacterium]
MSFLSILKELFSAINNVESGVKTGFRFSQKEIKEIVAISKKENLKYFEVLSKIPNLKYFDISFLLSQTNLDDEKIEIIKEAQKIYNEEEFKANGQTRSDFVFRVAANLEYLNMENIEVFKELVKCKNELYDFKYALENPVQYLTREETRVSFAFERIYTNN